ncbi:RRM domain-containing protein [Caenorhabditis elegans]|uniref:RRM domain-containing protein n=1 Tax=Caenorhabditis elegans TaxID=6239 RepID=H2KYB8_CAEEL|nr:RRM domain-containing protein [Caenorhabditis elegans]CCD62180.1 RRM domain-containing protein [Caenorhabditis elegans]|eukprot:NP_741283.1 Glutamate Receptor Level Decreased [Caenorhabditis elegans]
MAEERGRPQYRPNCNGLSSYYRERFGSHSPEVYLNLRISGFDDRLEREQIKQYLTQELKKYAPFEIKVVKNPEEDERLAYVNFERNDCARKVRYTLMDRLKSVLGKRVQCDPAGILRDQEGKYIPDRFNRAQHGADSKREGGSGSGNRGRPTKEPSTWRLKQDDDEATRTLFVGNMPSDVKEREIRHVFEEHGKVEEVDIKTPINTDAAYAFVMFQTVDQAIQAKAEEQDRPIRAGGSRMKIGYGKSQVSRRLFVGGLGSWCDKEILQKAFGEFGFVENIDYDHGQPYAYVVYENTHTSQEACRSLRGACISKGNHPIMVDYAKDLTAQPEKQQFMRKRRASKSPVGASAVRTPPGSPKDVVRNFAELEEAYAATWSGKMALKKTDYPVKFYRVYGAERLPVKLLRDEDDVPLRLLITQRLSLSSQNLLFDKLASCSSKELSLGVITGKKELSDLQPLVNYFTNKEAAGVVTVPGGILYIFPFCEFALKLLAEFTPQVNVFNENCPFLLGALAVRAPGTP